MRGPLFSFHRDQQSLRGGIVERDENFALIAATLSKFRLASVVGGLPLCILYLPFVCQVFDGRLATHSGHCGLAKKSQIKLTGWQTVNFLLGLILNNEKAKLAERRGHKAMDDLSMFPGSRASRSSIHRGEIYGYR